MLPVIILIVIVVVIALFLVSLYNGLVTKRNQIDESWLASVPTCRPRVTVRSANSILFILLTRCGGPARGTAPMMAA